MSKEHEYANDALYHILGEASRSITYRPALRRLVGDINAAILLQQIAFHFINKRREMFYKFNEPCEHPLYRKGDSWIEELAFTESELTSAMKKIATRVKAKEMNEILKITEPEFGPDPDKRRKGITIMTNRNHLVVYCNLPDNTLRYILNEKLLINAVNALQELPKQGIAVSETENPDPETRLSDLASDVSADSLNIEDSIEDGIENNIKGSIILPFSSQGSQKACEKDLNIEKAISAVWNTQSPALIAQIKKTLLGQHPVGSKHEMSNVKPPATADEILEFKDYYTLVTSTYTSMKMPRDPAKIQDWIYQVRDLQDACVKYLGYEIKLEVKIPSKLVGGTKDSILNYLRDHHKDEHIRVKSHIDRLQNEKHKRRKMVTNLTYQYNGEVIKLNVPALCVNIGETTLLKKLV